MEVCKMKTKKKSKRKMGKVAMTVEILSLCISLEDHLSSQIMENCWVFLHSVSFSIVTLPSHYTPPLETYTYIHDLLHFSHHKIIVFNHVSFLEASSNNLSFYPSEHAVCLKGRTIHFSSLWQILFSFSWLCSSLVSISPHPCMSSIQEQRQHLSILSG